MEKTWLWFYFDFALPKDVDKNLKHGIEFII